MRRPGRRCGFAVACALGGWIAVAWPVGATSAPAGMAARVAATGAATSAAAGAASATEAGLSWQPLGAVSIARTETTIGQFRRFAEATGLVTRAERRGGGQVFEGGWVDMPGWTWRAPFGAGHAPHDSEPAVHLGFDEAQAFCRWAGGRLPSDAQWLEAAYTERRQPAPAGWVTGRRYTYPTGDSPQGAQCLDDCGAQAQRLAVAVAGQAGLTRGLGHAPVGRTRAGVNGLFDMGANAWEWVDEPAGLAQPQAERRTRGGSWWYGASPMRADHLQSKPGTTAVVYIGFRCVR
jgi:formylglycine-generating enzyme required for sulfatase activity